MTKLSDRLKEARSVAGNMTQQKFSDLIGVQQRSWSRYETGATVPDAEVIATICEKAGVNADWLLFGTGPMKKGDKPSTNTATISPAGEPPYRKDVLYGVVEDLEEVLAERKKKFKPAAKAEVVCLLYEMMLAEQATAQTTEKRQPAKIFKLIQALAVNDD